MQQTPIRAGHDDALHRWAFAIGRKRGVGTAVREELRIIECCGLTVAQAYHCHGTRCMATAAVIDGDLRVVMKSADEAVAPADLFRQRHLV